MEPALRCGFIGRRSPGDWVRPTHRSAARLHSGHASSAASVCSAARSQVRNHATTSDGADDSDSDSIDGRSCQVARWATAALNVKLLRGSPSKRQFVCSVRTVGVYPVRASRCLHVHHCHVGDGCTAVAQVGVGDVLTVGRRDSDVILVPTKAAASNRSCREDGRGQLNQGDPHPVALKVRRTHRSAARLRPDRASSAASVCSPARGLGAPG